MPRRPRLKTALRPYGGIFDIAQKKSRIDELQQRISDASFWTKAEKHQEVLQELKYLKNICDDFERYQREIFEIKELVALSGDLDQALHAELGTHLERLAHAVTTLEIKTFFNKPYDSNNAILSLNAGAGGTESCDWAAMLSRMYIRWAEEKQYAISVLDSLPGEEAGIKNTTVLIRGDYAYGYLKSETGVHRLVRISPFDANKRRHTSFASVEVVPEIDDDIAIEFKENELRIDVYRSSGPGGQSVNTTDSAVRITHIPTGVVVTCQNERSQYKNKQLALKILKSKLYSAELQKRKDELSKTQGKKQKIEWGSQIRSYILQPYTMVKDHRTDAETSNAQAVLDGDIDLFIDAYLKIKKD